MTGDVLVVAGAVLHRSRVLLAQRDYPAEVAGLWELPGGKVESGETPTQALIRELCEELDVRVSVGAPLADVVTPREGLKLVAHRARIVSGTPRAVEHRAIAWVDAHRLAELDRSGQIVPNDIGWIRELTAELQVRPL
ncbi:MULTISPECIES: (deoxy)nucleoside triphosphate pyrophosphohydrolase [Gordonia]|uniref:(deoxy)nucleoside triphosphate pyrophosphohydrolase n=1 Tax=Gordonia TaxID=2053 RepID=UPI0005EF0482|nr:MULTISPECIES: (deoxy)nucleoside triphosphate pyrophosphohydrolase [Gordonia]KJR08063.1 DNA mismatch repair protein MutT [Gordonia sihwensis]KXT57672.1 DNA mismatch repair protein MutT [Gordonia sp. QH-12]WFN91857.1 (deoxy)nucleoside triphosphate pyrophosphohydrolase [Gordonia sihwensis]